MMFGMFEVLYGYLTRMLGSRNDVASSSGSLHAKVTDIKNGLTSLSARTTFPAVKNVQRGYKWFYGTEYTTTITISSVVTSKSLVFISTSLNRDSGGAIGESVMYDVSADLSSSTTITLKKYSGNYPNIEIYWQVIEFY